MPGVWGQATFVAVSRARMADPGYEWRPYWEYGSFLDARDLAEACRLSLAAPAEGHVVLQLAATDITTSCPTSREWVARLHPEVGWRGGAPYEASPYRGLVDLTEAERVLGWVPERTWRSFVDALEGGSVLEPTEVKPCA